MAKVDTRLSAAGYTLEPVFPFMWRWRALRPYAGQTGLAWGRRGAMRAARTFIRSQRSIQPFDDSDWSGAANDQKAAIGLPPEKVALRSR